MALSKREEEKVKARKTDAVSWAKKQDSGGESTSIKLPEGSDWYKLEVGVHQVDFMPFIAGDGNPRADKGMQHFERTYGCHRIQGPDGRSGPYCCLWETFGKPCPVCKRINNGSVDKQVADAMRSKTRHIWLVNDKPGDKRQRPKVLDSGHYNRGMGFAELMIDAINAHPQGKDFSDLEGGLTARLTVKEQSMPGFKFNAVTRIDFEKRNYNYPEELLNSMPCLDECVLPVLPNDLKGKSVYSFSEKDWHRCSRELEKILDGGSSVDEDESTAPEADPPVAHNGSSGSHSNGKSASGAAKKQVVEDSDDDDFDTEVKEAGPKSGLIAGNSVAFSHKGKSYIGKLKKVNKLEGTGLIEVEGKGSLTIDLDEMELAPDSDADSDDDNFEKADNSTEDVDERTTTRKPVHENDEDENEDEEEDEFDDTEDD